MAAALAMRAALLRPQARPTTRCGAALRPRRGASSSSDRNASLHLAAGGAPGDPPPGGPPPRPPDLGGPRCLRQREAGKHMANQATASPQCARAQPWSSGWARVQHGAAAEPPPTCRRLHPSPPAPLCVCRAPPTPWSTASSSSSRRTVPWCPPGTTSRSMRVRCLRGGGVCTLGWHSSKPHGCRARPAAAESAGAAADDSSLHCAASAMQRRIRVHPCASSLHNLFVTDPSLPPRPAAPASSFCPCRLPLSSRNR